MVGLGFLYEFHCEKRHFSKIVHLKASTVTLNSSCKHHLAKTLAKMCSLVANRKNITVFFFNFQ